MGAAQKGLAVAVAFLATGAVVAWAPPSVCLALAVVVAVWWCAWLEQHPAA